MAQTLWEQPITKYNDWGGGDFSGGAPVSGKIVQQFIKETLNKKFGYLYYNTENNQNKYLIFADELDWNKWYNDPVNNSDLILFTFDAPAPASIKTTSVDAISPATVITRFGAEITPIVFHYYIEDNSKNPVREDVIMRITATSKSSTKSEVITISSKDTYATTEKYWAEKYPSDGYDPTSSTKIGSRYEYTRLSRLLTTADNYVITITLTGATTQVSTSMVYEYKLVDLSMSTDFDYLSAISENNKEFTQHITVRGAEGFPKIFTMKVDGLPLVQNSDDLGIDSSRLISSGDALKSSSLIDGQTLEIFMRDSANKPVKWPNNPEIYGTKANTTIFTPGRHTLQMYVHINLDPSDETQIIQSTVLYFSFVIASESEEQTYLLYSTTLDNEYEEGEKIHLVGKQYSQLEYSIGLYTTQNRVVPVQYVYSSIVDGNSKVLSQQTHNLQNNEIDNVTYTLRDSGMIYLKINAFNSDNEIVDFLDIEIESKELEGVTISEYTDGNIFKYSAENRNINDPDRTEWPNTSKAYASQYTQKGALSENFNFNSLNGWDGTSLILRNGATVTFPFNLFNMPSDGNNEIAATGFTFEIDFETMNVQDDNAIIMDFAERDSEGYLKYNSYITIKATSAEMSSRNGNTIKTNFKESERIKLAFIVNPLVTVENNKYDENNEHPDDNPNTMFIMVNGVLDRVVRYGTGEIGSDSFKWDNPVGENANSFTIGNTDGKAAVKINSIRIYNKALKLDQEFMNYMNDQTGDELYEMFNKNNVFENDAISFDQVKNIVSTMIIGTDYNSFGSFTATDKKSNTFAEVQYFDKEDSDLNFYARQCWVSCQGTSSMSYPVKNLRLYFGKGWTEYVSGKGGTFQNINKVVSINSQNQEEETTTNEPEIITPEYETEFWPYSEYKKKYVDKVLVGTNDIDSILPYSTNKKVDGPDGSAIRVKSIYGHAVHDGYHKIGANRTMKGKIALLKQYLTMTELDPSNIDNNFIIGTKDITLYMVDPSKTYITVKDAFDNVSNVYATSGMDGYVKQSDGSWSEYKTGDDEIKYDAFTSKWTYEEDGEAKQMTLTNYLKSIQSNDTMLQEFLNANDLFISAYRPLLRSDESLNDESYATYIDELRYSGVKLYYWNGKKFKAYKGNLNINVDDKDAAMYNAKPWHNQLFYTLGSNWRQYNDQTNVHGYGSKHISGWTDRWTLKTDYAESSMTHNAGIGRLWGNAMYNVTVKNLNKCRTKAQEFVKGKIDIRTSCDGKPIALFYKQIKQFNEATGLPEYDDPKFGGLYNIMTDKSSTKLFGFEDITDPSGTKWTKSNSEYNSKYTECWECLNNGSDIIKGLSTAFDEKGNDGEAVSGISSSKSSIGKKRPLWETYEARWPDTGQERHEYNPVSNPLGNNWPDDTYGVDSKNLEGFLRWVNFCKDAIDYRIGANQEMDGYEQNIYIPLSNDNARAYKARYDAAEAIYNNEHSSGAEKEAAANEMKICTLYKKWNTSGNDNYSAIGETYDYIGKNPETGKDEVITADVVFVINENTVWYRRDYEINMEIVSKTVNKKTIGQTLADKIYVIGLPSFDSTYRCTNADGTFNEEESRKYYVDTYVWPNNNGDYEYYDNFGEKVTLTVAESTKYDLDPENEHTVVLSEGTAPVSCKNLTFMQYFSATKKDHLDLEKVAAYYIYLLRFGAVDQVVKNSMMTTEDGKHWYFINYDNDTILGVRNDGYLIYNWDFDRNSYDATLPGYSFAGSQSVLWNCLEMDSEFMNLVQQIDNQLNKQGLLSADAVLTWLNERQEGAWCQRLYNEQEKVKYLSTLKKDFSTDKYLGFMQGTRHSHRNWWVNHRWDLYDAKWSSGMYSLKQMSFIYTLSAGATNPQDMMVVTAASKYYFTMIRNTALAYSDWFKELDKEETGVFTIRQSNSVGDPIYLYGPQKLKVLNLRPNADKISRISLAEPYTVTLGDGSKKTSDWVDDDGPVMTKLLIGYDDTTKSSTATDISGLNKIYSLEEVDIRGMKNLNGAAPAISNLSNLHRWRAKNSNSTTFQPARSVSLYEVSLGNDTTTIALNDVEFTADPNTYKSFQDKAVSGNTSIGSTLGTKYGDILPQYTSFDAYKYCKAYQFNSETNEYELKEMYHEINDANNLPTGRFTGEYVFDYKPTSKLNTVIFNKVKGLDTFAFLTDLKQAIKASSSTAITKQWTVNITGFEWVIKDTDNETHDAVSKFIDMYDTFNYNDKSGNEQFSGTVYFNRMLTQEEYNELIRRFGENVFKKGNSVVVNCKEGVLMNVKGGTTTSSYLGYPVYDIIQGSELRIMASIFPMSDETKYIYTIKAASGWYDYPSIVPSQDNKTYTIGEGSSVYATFTNTDGEGVFLPRQEFDVFNDNTEGHYYEVSLYKLKNDGSIDKNGKVFEATTFIHVVRLVKPRQSEIVVCDRIDNVDSVVSLEGATNLTEINNELEHTFVIKYDTSREINLNVNSISVSFDAENEQYELIRFDSNDDSHVAAEIISEDGEYVDINNDIQEYSFKVKHHVAQFIEDKHVRIYIKMEMVNGEVFEKTLHYAVNCIFATKLGIYELSYENGEEVLGNEIAETSGKFEITDLGTYKYKVLYKNYVNGMLRTIEPNIYYDLEITDNPGIEGCDITIDKENSIINVVVSVNKTNFADNRVLEITAQPKEKVGDEYVDIVNDYITEVKADRQFDMYISYPDYIEMSCADKVLTNNVTKYVNSNLKTYAEQFNFNIPNQYQITNLPLKLKAKSKYSDEHEVTMSYAIEGVSLTINIGTPTVINITHPTVTYNSNNEPTYTGVTPTRATYEIVSENGVEQRVFKAYKASSTITNDDIIDENENELLFGQTIALSSVSPDPMQFTPVYEEVVLDNVHHLSMTSILVNSIAQTNIVRNWNLLFTCKLRYDNDNTTLNAETPYFEFTENGGYEIVFSMMLSRSRCNATSYLNLPAFEDDIEYDSNNDPIANCYNFYVVDNLNKFFKITAVKTDEEESDNVVNGYKMLHSFNNVDIAPGNAIGCGFVYKENNNRHPIFVSFKQFIGYSVGNTDDNVTEYNIGPRGTTEANAAADPTSYNGYKITGMFMNNVRYDQHRYSIFDKVYNIDSSHKYYVPSYAELSTIMHASVSFPDESLKALDAAMEYLVKSGYAQIDKDYNVAVNPNNQTPVYSENELTHLDGTDEQPGLIRYNMVDPTKLINVVLATSTYIVFISSTNAWVDFTYDDQNLIVYGIRIAYTSSTENDVTVENYEVYQENVRRHDDADGFAEDKRNIVIPFVYVS